MKKIIYQIIFQFTKEYNVRKTVFNRKWRTKEEIIEEEINLNKYESYIYVHKYSCKIGLLIAFKDFEYLHKF